MSMPWAEADSVWPGANVTQKDARSISDLILLGLHKAQTLIADKSNCELT
jgi:hypothetical protein